MIKPPLPPTPFTTLVIPHTCSPGTLTAPTWCPSSASRRQRAGAAGAHLPMPLSVAGQPHGAPAAGQARPWRCTAPNPGGLLVVPSRSMPDLLPPDT